jgi:hypothetical protein
MERTGVVGAVPLGGAGGSVLGLERGLGTGVELGVEVPEELFDGTIAVCLVSIRTSNCLLTGRRLGLMGLCVGTTGFLSRKKKGVCVGVFFFHDFTLNETSGVFKK